MPVVPAAAFTQAQIVRAVQGAEKAGLKVAAVEVCPDGVIRIIQKFDESEKPKNCKGPESWDD
jgi:hypothetical protein